MGIWSNLLVFGGGASFVIGLVHLISSRSLGPRRMQVWLGCLGCLTAPKALLEAWLYGAEDAATYGVFMQWQLATTFVWAGALIGFIQAYVGGFQRVRFVAWAAIGVALLVDLSSHHGLVFTEVDSLHDATLPWGEVISIGRGPIAGTRWLLDVSGGALAVFWIASCVRAFRTKPRAEAWLLAITCGVVLFLALGHGLLVDVGAVELPYLVTPAVFAFIGIFSVGIARQLVESVRLSKEVNAAERRWKGLLRDVQLLIAAVDLEGHIESVNPEFSRVIGAAEETLVGSDLLSLSEPREEDFLRGQFQELGKGVRSLPFESSLLCRNGEKRMILWSGLCLRDVGELPIGSLLVGFDITERRRSDEARDAALKEAQELREQLDHAVLCLPDGLGGADSLRDEFIGESPAIQEVRSKISKVAPTEATVVIQGETGVGKELVALGIHRASSRRNGPLVSLNCGAIPITLFESELFGHEAGAFTDAREARIGHFERADRGTLFLDEVGELPLEVQPKLLRALQTGEFERVGSSRTRRSNARIVVATHRDLAKEVEAGRFREDLFYRLNVFPIEVPPLRDRREDVPLLVESIVPKLCARSGIKLEEVSGALVRELSAYSWPGNVRELINVLERAVIVSGGGALRLAERLTNPDTIVPAKPRADRVLPLEIVIRRHIEDVLERSGGRISGAGGAADLLGLNPSTLRGRMRKLGLGPARSSVEEPAARRI